jgi:predicted Fe-Mo cluster-binding NifX family protein
MIIAIPICAGRISPVFDAARQLLLLEVSEGVEVGRRIMNLGETDGERRARRIAEAGTDVLICGAISSPLRAWLRASRIRVYADTCGPIDEVTGTFISGRWRAESFLMPGCRRHGGRNHARRKQKRTKG